jgi:hypothetical protein
VGVEPDGVALAGEIAAEALDERLVAVMAVAEEHLHAGLHRCLIGRRVEACRRAMTGGKRGVLGTSAPVRSDSGANIGEVL